MNPNLQSIIQNKLFWYGVAAGLGLSFVTKNKLLTIAILGGAAYLYLNKDKLTQTTTPVPPGGKLTGKVQATMQGGRPGEEVLGYGRRTWAEVILPSGQTDWLEVHVS